jgi:hypothetical protein
LADERQQAVNSTTCCVCMVSDQQSVLLPCKHASFCKECAVALQRTSPRCPLCRQAIESVMHVFK